ncbi:hypothetical protein MUB42_04495 [Apilactobacillus kunkeei]|nr:hypothetical protein MUB42_04495 [Apilactobacillus kunkeei]
MKVSRNIISKVTSILKDITKNKISILISRILIGLLIGAILVVMGFEIYSEASDGLIFILLLLGLVGFPLFMYKTDKDIVR